MTTTRARMQWALAIAVLGTCWTSPAAAERHVRRQRLSSDSLVRQCALIAHVRIAGDVRSLADQPSYFAEVIDAATGSSAGQIILLSYGAGDEGDRPKLQQGEQYVVLARREPDGTYLPLPHEEAVWKVNERGLVEIPEQMNGLVGPHIQRAPEDIIAHLWNECRQRDFRVTVRLDDGDFRRYQPDRPLRIHIEIHNTGGVALDVANSIDYEYVTPGLEKLKELRDRAAPEPKIFLKRLGRRHELAELEKRLQQLHSALTLAPNEGCGGAFDLSEEGDIDGGGAFEVWVEAAGRRSNSIVFELPQRELRALEKLAEALAEDWGGPLEKLPPARAAGHSMPSVAATLEGDILNAVLNDWCAPRRAANVEGKEQADAKVHHAILLRSSNVPADYVPDVAHACVIQADPWFRRDGEPIALTTTAGKVVFDWDVVQIDAITMDGQKATVRISQNRRHNLGGSGATYELERIGGKWTIVQVPERWIS